MRITSTGSPCLLTLLALPSLALASPQAADASSAVVACVTATGVQAEQCSFSALHLNSAAVAYLATAVAGDAAVSSALDAIEGQPGFQLALLPTATPTADPTSPEYASELAADVPPAATGGAAYLSLLLQQATGLPDDQRAPISSVLAMGIALQNAGVSESTSTAGAPAAPAQTAAGMAVGVLAGVIGLTLGM